MSIVREFEGVTIEVEHNSAGQLVLTLTTPVLRPAEDAKIEKCIEDLVQLVHNGLVVWSLL